MGVLDSGLAPALLGLAGGLILGLAARRGRFCTLGAIEDGLYGHDWHRLRMWGVALGVAILGTHLASEVGFADLSASIYAKQAWNPAASICGGLVFGYGMAIAGNCGFGALARLGGGDLRSLVIVIVTGVSAYMVMSGPLAALRVWIFPPEAASEGAIASYAELGAAAFGIRPVLTAALVALGLLAIKLWDRGFRQDGAKLFWGAMVGLTVTAGWIGTSTISAHSFDTIQIESFSFTAPLGESLLFLMTSSGGGLGFATGSVAGVLAGAVLGSISKGHFRWEACDDPQELGRQILGGALMGVGGVLALGCSVGQGLTAFATLTYSAPIVLAAIFVGASLGLRQLIRGFEAAL